MGASNALESRVFTTSVSRFNAVNQVLELGVDDVENKEQKRLTKYAAWTWSRGCTGDFRTSVRPSRRELVWRQALQVEALPP